jgi:hypothetical protein
VILPPVQSLKEQAAARMAKFRTLYGMAAGAPPDADSVKSPASTIDDRRSVSSEQSSMSYPTRASEAASERERQLMEMLAAQAGLVCCLVGILSRFRHGYQCGC